MLKKLIQKELPLFQAVSTLIGTIIGAGILGIPYVFARAGFWTGALVLVVITLAMVGLKLLFGEMTLRTYGKHQTSGYVEKYLGIVWRRITSIILILSISGSLLAYFIGAGEVLSEVFGGSDILWSLIVYALLSVFLYIGIKLIKRLEFMLTIIIFFIVVLILILTVDHLEFSNIAFFDLSKILIPYGVVLFACSGIVAVPEVRQILARREHLFKKAILLGSIIPSVIYFLFSLVVVSVTGLSTTEVATIGLGHVMGPAIIKVGNIFAFFTIITSFLTLGLALKGVYHLDLKIKHVYAWLLTISVPLVIYALGLHDFIKTISLASALSYGVNGLIYIATYWVARKKGRRRPEYTVKKGIAFSISIFLTVIFISGLIYTFADVF